MSEQLLVRLNVAIVARNWAEMLTRSLMTKLVSAFDAIVQHLGYVSEIQFRQCLEMTYLSVRVTYPVALALFREL